MLRKFSPIILLCVFLLTDIGFSQNVQTPSNEEDIKAALTGGVPLGRWKEGLLYEGVRPMPWLKSAANWFPGTEEVQPNEMRITFQYSTRSDEHINLC